jgi:hypothetical protein
MAILDEGTLMRVKKEDLINNKYTIPNGVTAIGYRAFEYVKEIEEVKIADTVKYIGDMAFQDCSNLVEVHIPNSVETIGDSAFLGCSKLTKIYIGRGVSIIKEFAFAQTGLNNVDIPASVTTVEKYAFNSCYKLTEVKVNALNILSMAFWGCEELNKVIIGSSVKNIGKEVFSMCEKLMSVEIPESVYVEDTAFPSNCKVVRTKNKEVNEIISTSNKREYMDKEMTKPEKYKKCRKKEYEVYMCMPPRGTTVTNKLEGTTYTTDEKKPIVISGTVGEQWVMDLTKLAKTYTLADGEEITKDTFIKRAVRVGRESCIKWVKIKTKPNNDANAALFVPEDTKFEVPTSWGDVLHGNRDGIPHGKGDFIVCALNSDGTPNMNDRWIVNGEIFATTYDNRGFESLLVTGTGSGKLVKPAELFEEHDSKGEHSIKNVKDEIKAASGSNNEAIVKKDRIKNHYNLTGRYMSGTEVTGYNIKSVENGSDIRATREQMAYLVGKGAVLNCEAQIYKDKLIIRGKGVDVGSLPVKQEASTKPSTNDSTTKQPAQPKKIANYKVTGVIKNGSRTEYYIIADINGNTKSLPRTQVLNLAKNGDLINARLQKVNDKYTLRGVDCDINSLPTRQLKDMM